MASGPTPMPATPTQWIDFTSREKSVGSGAALMTTFLREPWPSRHVYLQAQPLSSPRSPEISRQALRCRRSLFPADWPDPDDEAPREIPAASSRWKSVRGSQERVHRDRLRDR